jgi:ornithine decarboxylase
VRHTKPIPSIEVIGDVVNRGLARVPRKTCGSWPSRDASWYPTPATSCAECRHRHARGQALDAYWDAGLFGGVIETTEGLEYDVRHRPRRQAGALDTVAGPTCDSVDVVMRESRCPRTCRSDDFIYIPNAGAYTTAYASNFNGFPLPEVRSKR